MSKQEQYCYSCSLSSACNTWYSNKYPPCFPQGERSHSSVGKKAKVSLPCGEHNTTNSAIAFLRKIHERLLHIHWQYSGLDSDDILDDVGTFLHQQQH